MDSKAITVCELLQSLPCKMTPKSFLLHFLQSDNSDLAYRRRYWAESAVDSTLVLVEAIAEELKSSATGRNVWAKFIEQEAIKLLASQQPPKGNHPVGAFQSSTTVTREYLGPDEKEKREGLLTSTHMPFLYNILVGSLHHQRGRCNSPESDDELEDEYLTEADEGDMPIDLDVVAYTRRLTGEARVTFRYHRIVTTVCSMMCFASNRRANGLQLVNGVRFLACGMSERVHDYMNFIGLASSRWTALAALGTLAKEAQSNLKLAMAGTDDNPVGPSICIDNIDMVEKVHALSVGNRTHTFRGTWGYIHLPDPKLLKRLKHDDLSLPAYYEAMRLAQDVPIEPEYFLPTTESNIVEEAVWKSQIASVMVKYIAVPSDKSSSVPTDPPVVDQISHEKPVIHTLKLMDASDNCAEGVGQVFQSIISQTGIPAEKFYGRLQPMDGDLGTVQNFNCLRSQRFPNPFAVEKMNNCVFQLGAAHTLWNVASTIFTHHFGDAKKSSNCGAWQFLEALGFPSEKAIQKKDFTLMINQMERVLEGILFYCLRVIMKTNRQPIPQEVGTIPTDAWNKIVDSCYSRFCSSQARRDAATRDCPKLHNTLVMLHDFSSVVEASRSMKAGDIGRLLIVWKKWCLMSQSLSGMTNYSSYLPRMVLLLTVILPVSMQKFMQHNLLFSPSGRKNHFVAKDYHLETFNAWLKFFYNNTGNGTQIERLKEVYSLNIETVSHSSKK
ncbi:uncharacterized protein PGTG_02930 [Puccinia graminis f. sp. tritici CRL 75-36-700-3]|uniref:DUF6589 domain-containing protein n=1 Tax=Puccinia graminis f. sp. tritici (strain CRL 75-36-700-3 / race SCCL) TaxID=418459 RepID=E3JWR4_PUCGT|nr:uncharacterized protein PGTG_02930 [Puccinia graminis f. sp. tritici CRL 75-36-700-3]EFP76489.2 hypothetical protein PGTG_02930 [Puccinia graminis f. sp. tritici CRL 75-36-700-3]